NHILPTGGTARFSSPLGVYDFVKRTSILRFSREALQRYGRETARLADLEGFDAHSRSISLRVTGKNS
ncbi:MAG: histidinol dehydrogenase, partial [Syntrophales bacterium]|nr:histidinol dehydrogenase [Syntrophales bacterium]